MTIAFGIALSMDWEKPMWTGFTVAMISLSTIGQSINKAALRTVGTLAAALVGLTMIAWFAQDRWLLILSMVVLVGVCTYMMAGPRYQYFWHVLAFVTVIIIMSSNDNPEQAFYVAVVRAQETGLGILVYALVSLLLWPNDSRADFLGLAKQFAATQHQQYRLYFNRMMGERDDAELLKLNAAAVQQQTQLRQMLAAAQTDSYEVWELRRQWQSYQALVGELAEVLAQWRESFNELQSLELNTYFPNLEEFHSEIDRRFAQIERLLDGQAAESQPIAVELDVDLPAIKSLPHFHTAALGFTRSRAQKLEALTRDWFALVSDIKGIGASEPGHVQGPTESVATVSWHRSGGGFVFDPDRMLGAFHVMLFVCLCWLTLIYVEGVPGGTLVLMLGVPIAMAMATMPHIPPSKLFVPAAASVLFAGLIYIFIMPMISSFWGLGVLIFAVTFVICYLFAAPQQVLGRVVGLAMFIMISSIENQQSYSFMHVANIAMMFPIFFALLMLAFHVPFSPLPEKVFLRLLARYFKSAEYLTSTLGKDPRQPLTRTELWRKRYYARQVATLPRKLTVWGRMIDPRSFPGVEPGQVSLLAIELQALSFRLSALLEARQQPQAPELAEQLTQDVRHWRQALQAYFQRWSEEPALAPETGLDQRLKDRLDALEQRISETFEFIGRDKLDQQAYRNFYRLLGGFRGVSEAMLRYARQSATIDLMQMRESRF